ncbi:elongation factor P 5-aminopentanone reductase [Cytobacillus purgationiresistens]|uniref:3-oxoacyl-[acyl-carrier protein] reductase n=1 Tax=Cytobacillus purgationiresistens TaxID=863449 RepID=A0ABU0AH90_9BACI|nr:SDR family oxidoreductase [Cytobacillus purgationiresistens]MDQ0270157.1 3-oxoacyl-[acyl-carrier protein] reductase [Cytobacillus purgationiresistens]
MKKFALITGASGGIGQAIALNLAEQGYSLYLHYNQNQVEMERLLKRLSLFNGEFIPIQADLSEKGNYKKVSDNIFSIDVIVHCSGASHYGLFTELEDETAEMMFNLHMMSPVLLTKMLLPKMLNKGKGSIIFISSIWGQTGAACEVIYSTVKGSQNAFVKALSKEVALSGIRVNAIAPGAVDTVMMSGFTNEERAEIENDIPMGRIGVPENIADAASFLISDKASYITGQVIAVNGGWYT